MKKKYTQTTMFDRCLDLQSNIEDKYEEFQIDYSYDLPCEWEKKLNSYNFNQYVDDIEQYGIEKTWNYICKYVVHNNNVTEFLDISNFAELYETALAIENKKFKKENGQYYTPKDVALVMAGWLKDLNAYNVCDVGCGTGNLILVYLELIGTEESIKLLNGGRIYLYDLDKTALTICKTAILVKYGEQYLNKVHAIHCDFLDKNIHLPKNCKVIANPPYAKISTIPSTWQSSKVQLETKELYTSFMEKIILESDKSVIITPYSFIGGKKFYALRWFMNKYSGFIVSFDNVPGNIFCGRKHGVFNSNKTNSVRAAITVVQNDNFNKGFRLTPLIRFKNEERQRLLDCKLLESKLSNKYQLVDKTNTSFSKCHKELQDIYEAWLKKSNKTIKDVHASNKKEFLIYMPNTCRYFTTASCYKLKRAGMMVLGFDNEDMFNFVYCLINSSFAYWWWRIFDGGITYPIGLLNKLPVFDKLLSADDKRFFANIASQMISVEKDCLVTKLNAGKVQENIKFPSEYRNKINQRILKILGFANINSNIFDLVHKNSIFGGFEEHD